MLSVEIEPEFAKAELQIMSLGRLLPFVFLCLVLLSSSSFSQSPINAKLARVDFEGLAKLTPEQLLKTAGLEIGQTVTETLLDAAAQRLIDSGLVKSVGYRYRPSGNQAVVTFQIEEAVSNQHRALFDNFIWFTDEELTNALRSAVPSYNGVLPDSGNLTETVKRALQAFLTDHKINGKVEYLPSTDLSGRIDAHVFVIRGLHLPICTLHFPGTHNVDELKLMKAAQEIVRTDYLTPFH